MFELCQLSGGQPGRGESAQEFKQLAEGEMLQTFGPQEHRRGGAKEGDLVAVEETGLHEIQLCPNAKFWPGVGGSHHAEEAGRGHLLHWRTGRLLAEVLGPDGHDFGTPGWVEGKRVFPRHYCHAAA